MVLSFAFLIYKTFSRRSFETIYICHLSVYILIYLARFPIAFRSPSRSLNICVKKPVTEHSPVINRPASFRFREHWPHVLHFTVHSLCRDSMAIEWSLDYCLVCDRQIVGGAYCSQACRLAELDQLSDSGSPTTTGDAHAAMGTDATRLQPPLGNDSTTAPPAPMFSQRITSPVHVPLAVSQCPPRALLTPSSSQTSLSSLQSSSSQSSPLSDRVRDELRDYASCFDQVRDWKRRLTTSWCMPGNDSTVSISPPLITFCLIHYHRYWNPRLHLRRWFDWTFASILLEIEPSWSWKYKSSSYHAVVGCFWDLFRTVWSLNLFFSTSYIYIFIFICPF